MFLSSGTGARARSRIPGTPLRRRPRRTSRAPDLRGVKMPRAPVPEILAGCVSTPGTRESAAPREPPNTSQRSIRKYSVTTPDHRSGARWCWCSESMSSSLACRRLRPEPRWSSSTIQYFSGSKSLSSVGVASRRPDHRARYCRLARGVAGCLPVNALPVTDVQQSGVVRFDLGVEGYAFIGRPRAEAPTDRFIRLGTTPERDTEISGCPVFSCTPSPPVAMDTHRLSSLRVHPFRRESHAMRVSSPNDSRCGYL
jgi:hypothetical protein